MPYRALLCLAGLLAAHCQSTKPRESTKPLAVTEPQPRRESNCPPAKVVYEKRECPPLPATKIEKPICPPAPSVTEKICPEPKPAIPPACPQPTEKVCEATPPTNVSAAKIKPGSFFVNFYEEKTFFDRMESEHAKFGKSIHVRHAKKKKYRGSLVEQRSGRKRLYDHNLFLRRLFAGKLALRDFGDLASQFEGALFLDIGSAILSAEGAVTVRDLYEDAKIAPHLTFLASDINDKSSPKTRYIEIYRKQKKQLPFEVVEISPLMTRPEKFTGPIQEYLANAGRAVMLRAANTGPDLYYDEKQLRLHLKAALEAFEDRNLMYFFNKFILYKPRPVNYFMVIGEIDENVGTNHKEATWEDIDWSRRRFEEGVLLNQAYW